MKNYLVQEVELLDDTVGGVDVAFPFGVFFNLFTKFKLAVHALFDEVAV